MSPTPKPRLATASLACLITVGGLIAAAPGAGAQDLSPPPAGRRPRVESHFSPNGGVAAAVVAEIEAAQRSLDVAMYSVSTGTTAPIMGALERATSQRGVVVRMILNKARTGARNKQKSLALEAIGVDVRYVGPTMHEKFAIVDSRVLLNGSANWSNSADRQHSENLQVIRSPRYLVRAFGREFRTLMDHSRDFDPADYQ